MSHHFYRMNSQVLKFDYKKDIHKIIFNHYIMKKENFYRTNKEFPDGQFPITVRNVSDDLGISIGSVHRILKEFRELKIIELIEDGAKNKKYSIYKYLSNNKKTNFKISSEKSFGTCFGTSFGTSKIDNIKKELEPFYQVDTKELKAWEDEFGFGENE